ncbi:MAG: TonB-dependent receptor, partial [Bacteroidota bacterium]|nr:TonB-dependent receptor [Bacteroidota bacterium]
MKLKKFTLLLAFMLMSVMLFAQVTTSGLSGKVVGKDNLSLPGATVVAIHEPTGTKYVTVTNANGQFSFQGMKAGGPYTVNVSFVGYSTSSYRDITLALGDIYNLSVTLNESTTSIAEVVIVANKTAFRSVRTGAVSNITATQMKSIPSINRTLSDYTKLSPYSTGSGSYLGKDAYTSNITIDGANFNNNFGLSSTNMPGASGEPISMEAIDEIQVSVAPFDVRESNFTGAGVNAITKSGTNQFKGSAYYYYRDQSFNGNKGRDSINGNARKYSNAPMTAKSYGFTFGGPIIKN